MHDYTTQYINHCSVCIRAKKHNYKQHGVLCPLLILEGPWQWTESNHIVKLPKSKGFNSILYKIWRSTVVIPQLILVPCLEHHCPAQSLSSIQYLVYPSLAQHITISYVTWSCLAFRHWPTLCIMSISTVPFSSNNWIFLAILMKRACHNQGAH